MRPQKAGFTLLEILMVMAVIALLGGMVAGLSSLARRRANETRARADIQVLKNALEEYRLENHTYFDTGDTVQWNMSDNIFTGLLQYASDVRTNIFIDPWDNAYRYRYVGPNEYELWSLGVEASDSTDDILQ